MLESDMLHRYTLSEVPLHVLSMTTLVRDRLHRKGNHRSSRPVNSSRASVRTRVAMERSPLSDVSWMYARDNGLQRTL